MADTHYFYRIKPADALLRVTDVLAVPNVWQEIGDSGKLVVSNGIVDTRDDRQILHSGPPDNLQVVTLLGASWQSKPGDTGDGTCQACQNTPSPQHWTLERVE